MLLQQSVHSPGAPNDYSGYLPFNAMHQPASHLLGSPGQGSYDAGYAMSPDSSSLSTTSSSPSEHSLYQSSVHAGTPMPQYACQPQQHGLNPVKRELMLDRVDHLLVENVQPASEQLLRLNAAHSVNTTTTTTSSQPSAASHQHHHRSSPIHLWEFLKELLQQVDGGGADVTVIRWLDKQRGVFKIEDSVRVAKLWGKRKNKPKMNYDKLSRSIRQYYKKGIMKKTDRSQRLVYQFCSAYCL